MNLWSHPFSKSATQKFERFLPSKFWNWISLDIEQFYQIFCISKLVLPCVLKVISFWLGSKIRDSAQKSQFCCEVSSLLVYVITGNWCISWIDKIMSQNKLGSIFEKIWSTIVTFNIKYIVNLVLLSMIKFVQKSN